MYIYFDDALIQQVIKDGNMNVIVNEIKSLLLFQNKLTWSIIRVGCTSKIIYFKFTTSHQYRPSDFSYGST